MKIRATSRNILLSFASLFTVVLILEILLRLTHLFSAGISCAEPDPVLGWRFTPGRTYFYHEENNHPITGRINGFGWRDTEWTREKPQGTYRIAVLGDSCVEAFQVELDATFHALTEGILNKVLDFKVELMSFGRSGMTQTEEFLVLKNNVIKFSPDMVILFFYLVMTLRMSTGKLPRIGYAHFIKSQKMVNLFLIRRLVRATNTRSRHS